MDDDSLSRLTRSQREYLALVSLGLRSKEIAPLLGKEASAVDTACKRAGVTTGIRDRFVLARLLAEREPELIQSMTQRLGLTPKTLAELRNSPPDEVAPTVQAAQPGNGDEQSWTDLSPWQKRLWAIAIALGALALASFLVEVSHRILMGASTIH